MTRLGWGILIAILLAAGAFASMLSFGPGSAPSLREARIEPPTVAPGAAGTLPVPVAGVPVKALIDTWAQARGGGTRLHEAIDIMAPRGTPVSAAAAGRVEKLFLSHDGGNTIYIRSPDGARVYYYAHLDAYRAGLSEGQAVKQGETIATVGSTGNASPDGPHLHFAIKRMAPGDRWWQGEPINPYPLLVRTAAGR